MQRMRLKGHDSSRPLQLARSVDDAPKDFSMTKVDTVEIADRQNRPARSFRQFIEISYYLHFDIGVVPAWGLSLPDTYCLKGTVPKGIKLKRFQHNVHSDTKIFTFQLRAY